MATVYLVVDTGRHRPPIWRVDCRTAAELDFVRGMDGEYAGNIYMSEHESDSDDEAVFGVRELEAWLGGQRKEDLFSPADLAAGVWPAVLTDDFRARFVFLAMVCR